MILGHTTVLSVRAEPENWWNNQWPYRKLIVIDPTKLSGTLEDFPVLIDIMDDQLATRAQSDGDDIAFADALGNKLDHEIELYNSNDGHLVAWIRVPVLSVSSNTNLYMYYGNSEASAQQEAAAVWGSRFGMVQHLNEHSGTHFDSTWNGNNATPYNGVVQGLESKIDGGDMFDGLNDYLDVPHSDSLVGSTAFTASVWMKLNSVVRRQTLLSKYDLPVGKRGWFLDWRPASGYGPVLSFFMSTDGVIYRDFYAAFLPTTGVWYHVVVAWSSGQTPLFYVNGIELLTIHRSRPSTLFKNEGVLLKIGRSSYDLSRDINGALDEIRISTEKESKERILTSYNNQMNPSGFYSIGDEEALGGLIPPSVSNEEPNNNAVDVYTNPTLSVYASDNERMTIIFRNNDTGAWKDIAKYIDVGNGRYSAVAEDMNQLGATYWWMVCAYDGQSWTNKTYSFTVTTTVLTFKWRVDNLYQGTSGVLTYDVNGDGIEEVVYVGGRLGEGSVTMLSGLNGTVLWSTNISGLDEGVQPQMADLNKDGIPEIIVPIQAPAGIQTLFAQDGSTYWRKTGLGGQSWSSPVVTDIHGSGYPTIFISSTDVYEGLNSTGKISALSSDGEIVQQAFIWRPCLGGLSIADADNDGEFELYMGDRYMYMTSDNGYGKGVQSFWAENLTSRWYRPDILSSSHVPMIADVDKDGILDVIAGHQRGGVAVLSSVDGGKIKASFFNPNLPVHYQPSVYDIDNDTNLEMLMADGFHYDVNYDPPNSDIVVFDLVNWTIDARINVGLSKFGPQIADVTGDGIMDIVAANYTGIFVFDRNYSLVGSYTGLHGILNYAVTQDVDGDGYYEVLVTDSYSDTALDARVYCFDTPARKPQLRPRSEVQYYSERRLGVAEYEPLPGSEFPTVSAASPSNNTIGVPVLLSYLSFDLTSFKYRPMNYSVSTYPNVGSGYGAGVGNGHYRIKISNLAYHTTYSWSVNATDGRSWTNNTYTFTTESNPGWWDVDWEYRKEICVDPRGVTADQKDFPLLIDLIDDNLKIRTRPDGNDIVFTDSNNVPLDYSVERYNQADGHLVAWIKMSFVSSKTYTKLYMYYGNPSATNRQNPAAVWDANYTMVLHLNEISGMHYDSTANDNDGTPHGVAQGVPGKIDGSDYFNGVKNYIGVAHSDTLSGFTQGFTTSFWLELNSTSRRQTILSKYDTAADLQKGWFIEVRPTSTWGWVLSFFISPDGISYRDYYAAFDQSPNVWYYVTVVWSPDQIPSFYVNGEKLKTKLGANAGQGAASFIFNNEGVALDIGRTTYRGLAMRHLNGTVDEIQISNISRSESWILTSYNNQLNSSSFLNIGSEETIPQGPFISDPSPSDRSAGVELDLGQLTFKLQSYQSRTMNYTVTTNPDVGSGGNNNVEDGQYSIDISNLAGSTTYTWVISATDGVVSTGQQYRFTTSPSIAPTQGTPLLQSSSGNPDFAKTDESLKCFNQTTYDPEGSKVTNIFNWYRNNISLNNLLFAFDTNSSALVRDYSGYNNNGNTIGQVTWTSNGVVGGAYNFERGYIEVPSNSLIDGSGSWSEITVEHWIYLAQSQDGTRTIAKIPSYEIGISANRVFAGIWIDTGQFNVSGYNKVTYNTVLTRNAWYHIAFTYNGAKLTLYVNGAAVATTSVTGRIQASGNEPLYIGWFDFFKGKIDEVRIYSKCLSAQQIEQRYEDTRYGTTSSSTIVMQETQVGDVWKCQVIPTDSYIDGEPKFSNEITIVD